MPATNPPHMQAQMQRPQAGVIDCFIHSVESKGVDLPLIYSYGTAERDAVRELFLSHIPGTYDLSGGDVFLEEDCHELWLNGKLVGLLLMDMRSIEDQAENKTTYIVSVVVRGLFLSEPYRDVGIGKAFLERIQTHCRPSFLQLVSMGSTRPAELQVEVGTFLNSDFGNALSEAAAKALWCWLDGVRQAYKLTELKVSTL